MPLAADPESTSGHYNKQRGPNQACKVEEPSSLGGELLSWPCGETTLTQSSVLVTQEVNLLTHTYRERERERESGATPHPMPGCYDTGLKELIECTRKL